MSDFFATLLIIILVIWCAGWIIRLLFRRWLGRKVEEFNRAAGEAQKEARRQARGNREGDVTVDGGDSANGAQKVNRDVGEYVEFEEIVVEEEGEDKQ